MKKQLFAITLAIALCLSLMVSVSAYDVGKVGETNIVSTADGSCTGFIDKNGTLWMWGKNTTVVLDNDSSIPVKVMDNVTAVSCGDGYAATIKTDGSLWMWGTNHDGQLGNGMTENSSIPVKVMDNVTAVSCGNGHVAAIKTDGSLWLWGENFFGQLGNGTNKDSSIPIKVMDNVTAVCCGMYHTAAIKTDGSLWLWGINHEGQLGNGTQDYNIKAPVKVLDNVISVSCWDHHTAAIKADGSLWTWGSNTFGELGNGNQKDSNAPVKVLDGVVSVSCGYRHTAAIKTDGSLWAWGDNENGQLGNGGGGNATTTYIENCQTIPVKVLENVTTVSCGYNHTAAIKTDGSLWTWGNNIFGKLGYEDCNATSFFSSSSVFDFNIQTVPKQVTGLTGPRAVRTYLNGGIGAEILWENVNGTITVPTNPTRSGYTFGGWYTDTALTNPWNFNDKVTPSLALYAKWIPVSSTDTTTGKSSQTISLNGEGVSVDAYTLKTDNGGEVTYVKLRDVAALLNGTSAQFDVDWRNHTIYVETNTPYIHQAGTELQPIQGTDGSYRWNQAPILFDGKTAPLEGIVITDGNGGGHTFFKLRDLADAIGFTVNWSAERGIYIETN